MEEATEAILRDAVNPWIFFQSHGVHIKKVDGSSINIGPGFEYSGSAVEVFWGDFIDAYIKKRSRELIESTRLKAIERNIPVDEALKDCYAHLRLMVEKIFYKMADIDQKLRGKGYPKSVQKKRTYRVILKEILRQLRN